MTEADREKVERLLESLSGEKSIDWDSRGVVYIDGKKLAGSHLGKLITAVLQEPKGIHDFRKKLMELGLL